MKNSMIFTMSGLVILGLAILMWLNYAPTTISPSPSDTSTIPSVDIRGVAIIHDGLPYTLNFEQQKLIAETLLRAVEVKKIDYPKIQGPFNFDKFIIYRFKGSDVEIIPIIYNEQNLVFSAPELNDQAYYMELSGGQLKQMIPSTYD